MNIAICTYGVTRKSGGVFYAVRDLFASCEFEDQNLHVFSFFDEENGSDISSWKNVVLHLFRPGLFLFNSKLKKEIICSDYDLLHMHALWRYPQLLMDSWSKYNNSPIVCTPHGMLDPYIIRKQGGIKRVFAKLFLQRSLNKVSCFHALCHKELEDIRSYGLTQPVAIIPNGVSIVNNNYKKRDDSKRHLLYLGRIHKKKGIDLLLLALAQIMQENKSILSGWQVDIVGWDDENCKSDLEKIVKSNDLEGYVKFYGGLFGDEKSFMFANSDAFILPSHGEGLPMSVLEAWSWNLPVVMTPYCNIPEGFEANAAIKVNDDVMSVMQGIKKLFLMSDAERRMFGKNGRNLVETSFSWNVSAMKMIKLYEWLVGKGEQPDFVYL